MDRNLVCMKEVLPWAVALRKESVDRNLIFGFWIALNRLSLSARRAWIEIRAKFDQRHSLESLSARRAWIEIWLGIA